MKDTFYFIAIGGIGMSGLAKYLVEDGFQVLGSDIKRNRNIDELEKLGAKIFIGHNADNIPENCTVIASTAIKDDNPELIRAKQLGLKILHRSDMLAMISNGINKPKKNYFLGFCGTHGKTTTSGLTSYVLQKANLSPAFVVGGIVPEFGINSNAGSGDFFVAELDESDGTIVKYTPEISVINNLDLDHTDFYTNGLQSILDTFKTYLNALAPDAKILINNDNDGNKQLIEQNQTKNFITFGLNNANYVAKNISLNAHTSFDIYKNGELLTKIKTQLAGIHNVYNTLAVVAALSEANVNIDSIKEHFFTFTGMGRRLQKSAQFDDITVFDDYAHHPTEIKATLDAIKLMQPKRLVAVFQPHRYTRLKELWNDFLSAFAVCDKVFVTDVYAASENAIEGVTGEAFEKDLLTFVPCEYLGGSIPNVAQNLLPKLESGDIVVGLGAGTITTLGKDLLSAKNTVNV